MVAWIDSNFHHLGGGNIGSINPASLSAHKETRHECNLEYRT